MTLPFRVDQQTEATLSLTMNSELAAAMNQWRLAQTPPLTVNEAIYALLWRGLTADAQATAAATPIAPSGDPLTQELIRGFQQFLAASPHKPRAA